MTPRTARIILALIGAAFLGFLAIVGVLATFLLVIAVIVGVIALWLILILLVCRALDGDPA